MDPRIRGTAKVLNARPRRASKLFTAVMSPIVPALTSSSKSASTARLRESCRATWWTRFRFSSRRESRAELSPTAVAAQRERESMVGSPTSEEGRRAEGGAQAAERLVGGRSGVAGRGRLAWASKAGRGPPRGDEKWAGFRAGSGPCKGFEAVVAERLTESRDQWSDWRRSWRRRGSGL